MSELLRKLLFLPEASSTFAHRSDRLHFFIIGATMLVATCVGVVGLSFLVRYRRRAQAEPTPEVHAPRWVEAVVIFVPLGIFLLWFVIGFRDYVWASSPPADALDVYVSAKQWMWKFSYPDGPSTINVLYVPAGRPVRLLLTSRDVIHSFFVPDFRLKRDAVPSRYTELWFEAPTPGRHEVLCAEYCGLDHSVMRAEVVVLAPAEFETWRARAPELEPVDASLVAMGKTVAADVGCLNCHSLDGSSSVGPSFKGLFGKEELLEGGQRVRVDEGYLTESMMEPSAKVVAGFAPVMPSFFGQLSAGQAAALVEFIASLRAVPPPQGAE